MNGQLPDLSAYSLAATAIAGRPLTVRSVAAGSAAYTDGESVFIPHDTAPGARFALVAMHASLLGAGSDNPEVLRRLRGNTRTARRYLAVESVRAHRCLAWIMPPSASPSGVPVSQSPAESLAIAQSARRIPELGPEWGTLRPKKLLVQPTPAPNAGDAMPDRLRDGFAAEANEDDDDQSERSKILEMLSAPLGGNNWLSKKLLSLAGADWKSSTSSGSPIDRVSKHRKGNRSRGKGMSVVSIMSSLTSATADRDAEGSRYPEWDVHRQRFREAWCTVYERELSERPGHTPDLRVLRYPLGRSHLDLRRSRRERLGDEVDVDALITARSDARSGYTPDDRIYSSLRRLGRDLGVLILIDVSGSTADGSGSTGTVLDAQISAAGQLARRLEVRGDRVAIYGFNSRGRSSVYLYKVKEFRHGADLGWQGRLGRFEPAGFTRMGAAIRHATTILTTKSGARREILLVLSDGIPYDEGYELRYATADTRRALEDARDSGVGCLCLSLGGQHATAELQSVFGTSAFAHAERLADIGPTLKTLFDHALLAAERANRRRQKRGDQILT